MGCGASKITEIKINSFEKILDSYIQEKEQKEIEQNKKKYEDNKQNFPDSSENQLKNNSQIINSKNQYKTSNASVQHQKKQQNSSNNLIEGIKAKYKQQKEEYMIKYKNLLLSKKQAKQSDELKIYLQKKKELNNFVELFKPIQKQLLLAYPCFSDLEFVNLPEIQLKDEKLIKALIKEQSKEQNKKQNKTNQIQNQTINNNDKNKQKEMLNSTQDIILKEKQELEKYSQSNEKQGTMSENPKQYQENQLNQTNKKQNNEINDNQRENQQVNQFMKKNENKSQNQQNPQIETH